MALSAATAEALYLKQLIKEIDPKFKCSKSVIIYEDNQGAIALVNNHVHHQLTKHIDIRFHFMREQIVTKCIAIKYLQTDLMISDSLTKPLGRIKLEFCNKVLFNM